MGWQDDPIIDPKAAVAGPPAPGLWSQDPIVPDPGAPPPAVAGPPAPPQSVADLEQGEGPRLQRSLLRGATFGLSDKLAALQDAGNAKLFGKPGDFWDNYHASLDREHEDTEKFAGEHPIAARAAWGTGAIMAPIPKVPLPGLSVATTLPGRMVQGAGVGGEVGTVAGLGASDDKSLSGDLRNMAIGGVTGGALGGALPAASTYLLSPLWARVRQWWGGQAAVRSAALNEVGERLHQDTQAGGPTAGEMTQRLAGADGKPLTIADVAAEGGNVQGLLGSAARQQGPGRTYAQGFIRGRDNFAQQRLEQDASDFMNGGNAWQTSRDLITQRSAAAKPAYAQALSETDAQGLPRTLWSPRLQTLLDTQQVMGPAIAKGVRLEAIESAAEGRPFNPNALGVDLDQQGNVVYRSTPNMGVLNVAKKGIDELVSGQRDSITGRLSQEGVALDKFRHAYLGELDNLNPDYAAARAAWGGPTEAMDSLRAGQGIFTKRPEEIADEFNHLTPTQQDFYRMGAADTVRMRMANTGARGDESNVVLGKGPAGLPVRQLEQIFGSPDHFSGFLQRAQNERDMFNTGVRLFGNSATAGRMAEDAARGNGEGHSFLGPAMEAAAAAHMGEPMLALKSGTGALTALRSWATGPTPAVNAEIPRILLNPNAAANRQALLQALASAGRPSNLPRVTGPAAYLMGKAYPSLVYQLGSGDPQQ